MPTPRPRKRKGRAPTKRDEAPEDDPLADAIEGLLSAAATVAPSPASIPVAEDGLLAPAPLLNKQDVCDAFAVSFRQVAYWRGLPWWPGTPSPEPFQVDARELDAALREQGLDVAMVRRKRAGRPLLIAGETVALPPATAPRRGGHRDARVVARESVGALVGALDLDALAAPVVVSESIADDITNARAVEARLRQLISALPSDTLADPARARVFMALAEASSRNAQRIAQQEQAMLKTQRERGELVSVEVAQAMAGAVVGAVVAELRELVGAVVDGVKSLELDAYGSSRIDSLVLADVVEELINDVRERAADALASGGPPDAK